MSGYADEWATVALRPGQEAREAGRAAETRGPVMMRNAGKREVVREVSTLRM